MKSTYFRLADPTYEYECGEDGFHKEWALFRIPILPAYAIASYTLQGMKRSVDGDVTSLDSTIDGDVVKVYGVNRFGQMVDPLSTLIVNYLGIRDYTKFFPHFDDDSLRVRAAEFLEEADKTFDESSWLSFVLTAGAVLESFLVDVTGKEKLTLGKLLDEVRGKGFLNEQEITSLEAAVEARNLIHAGRHRDPYIQRARAMAVRLSMEQFLRKNWEQIKREHPRGDWGRCM